MFAGANFLSMSHWVFGKYAVGVPHASVLIKPELLSPRTSDGTSLASRGQNQILMNVGVRSNAYLHTYGVQLSSCAEEVKQGAGRITHHPPPLLLNAGP